MTGKGRNKKNDWKQNQNQPERNVRVSGSPRSMRNRGRRMGKGGNRNGRKVIILSFIVKLFITLVTLVTQLTPVSYTHLTLPTILRV